MKLIAHRGFWTIPYKKNSFDAIELAFKNNFGVETDIRDFNGKLVIAHDVAVVHNILLKSILQNYKLQNLETCLALNIKADGLSELLKEQLIEYNICNYFVFDMSIPETLKYLKLNMNVFLRLSEYEKEINPILYNLCTGIWLDAFNTTWYSAETIDKHLNCNKKIAIVSCELHERNYEKLWELILFNNWHKNENIMLCTDVPLIAQNYFKL